MLIPSFFSAVFKWSQNKMKKVERPDPFHEDEIRILSVTWNLAGKTPDDEDMRNLLHPQDIHHDIYVIGTQEALGGIVGAMFSPSKRVMN